MIDPAGFNELKLCRSGPMLYNKNDWPIGTSLKKYGEFSWLEVEIFRKFVAPKSIAVDVGANIGTHTIELSRMAGFVLAFEPQRLVFQTLCANIALNHCTNVKAFETALGRETKLITVPLREPMARNNFGGVMMTEEGPGEIGLMEPLDRYALSSCGFIKVDIEGMEADFLEGAKATIAKHRPILYMEADGAQKSQAIATLLESGYECWWSLVPLFNAENHAGEAENVFVAPNGILIVSINMLCIPAERKIGIIGLKRITSPDDVPVEITEREEALV